MDINFASRQNAVNVKTGMKQLRERPACMRLSFCCNSCSFELSTWPSTLNVLTLSCCRWSKWNKHASVFLPDTLHECLSEAGQSLNELPVELPEGESSSARPGDLTCRQMIAALFSLTPLFEKSSGFNRKCPRCFDTVAWIPSPPGVAYGHSMPVFMWENCSAKTVFSSLSHPPSLFLYLSIDISPPPPHTPEKIMFLW